MLPQPLKPVESIEQSDARILAIAVDHRRADTVRALRHAGALALQGVVVILLLSLFILRVPQVAGHSMAPRIEDGDHVVINTVAYDLRIERPGGDGRPLLNVRLRPVARGDVVAFVHGSGDDRRIYMKRVVGLPGETIAIERGIVSVNGVTLVEPYGPALDAGEMPPVTVPADSLFVLGDNRPDSDDSRSFGPISDSAVIGRAAFVAWPPNRARSIR